MTKKNSYDMSVSPLMLRIAAAWAACCHVVRGLVGRKVFHRHCGHLEWRLVSMLFILCSCGQSNNNEIARYNQQFYQYHYKATHGEKEQALEDVRNMLKRAEDENSHYGKTLAHLDLAYFAAQNGSFDEMYREMAIANSSVDASDPPFLKGYTFYVEGVINYNTSNSILTLQCYNRAIEYFEPLGDSTMMTRVCLNKYSYFIVQGQDEDAKRSLDEASLWCTPAYRDITSLYQAILASMMADTIHKLDSYRAWIRDLKEEGSPMLEVSPSNVIYWIYYYNNLIRAFVQTGQLDSADYYCEESMEVANKHGSEFEKYMTLTNKAWLKHLHGQYEDAIALCRQVCNDFDGIYANGVKRTCLRTEMLCHQALSDYQEAFRCLQEIERIDNLSATHVSTAVQFLDSQHDYEQRISQLEDNRTQYQYIIFMCLLIIGIMAGLFIIYNLKHRIKMQQEQIQRIKQEQHMIQKQQELEDVRMEHILTREQLTSVSEQIRAIAYELPKNIRFKLIERVSQLQGKNERWEWNDFEKDFSHRNHEFIERLKADYPELSTLELKICMLIRAGVSNKEIASTLHLADNTVRIYRTRIRKKMRLGMREEDLNSFIENLN